MRKLTRALFVLLFACTLSHADDVYAYADSGQQSSQDQGGGSAFMSERVYKRLNVIYEELIDKEDYNGALSELNELLPSVKGYERAVVLQTVGQVYIYKSEYRTAINYFEQALGMKTLPKGPEQQAILVLAQLYTTIEEYQKAIKLLESWFPTVEDPPADAYILAATAYAQLERYRDALPYVQKAIEKAANPREDWYKLLLAIHFELGEYRNAAAVLEIMVSYWPDNSVYWKQLSSLYMELQDDVKALSTLAVAYKHGMLEDERDMLNLARLYLLERAPYQAAEILKKGLESETIEPTRKNLELLANALVESKEYPEAGEVLGRAADLAEDGALYLRQAQLYAQQHKWDKVVEAVDKALKKGDLKNPGMAYILQGRAAVESKNYEVALRAFRKAREYEDTENQATQWIQYIQNDLIRLSAT